MLLQCLADGRRCLARPAVFKLTPHPPVPAPPLSRLAVRRFGPGTLEHADGVLWPLVKLPPRTFFSHPRLGAPLDTLLVDWHKRQGSRLNENPLAIGILNDLLVGSLSIARGNGTVELGRVAREG